MGVLSKTLIFLVGLINLLPVTGVWSAQRLEFLYGVVLSDPSTVLLMRHRAILLGIVGGLLIASVFHSPLRVAAYAAGLVSMLSFVFLAWLVGAHNPELRRVVAVDVAASAALVAALLLDRFRGSGRIAA